MHLAWFRARLAGFADRTAIVWRDREASYAELLAMADEWHRRLDAAGVRCGTVVALESDFSPAACALLVALIERAAIAVPLAGVTAAERAEFLDIAQVQVVVSLVDGVDGALRVRPVEVTAPLLRSLAERGQPGLVLFSSGATGKSKGVVHDFSALLEKFRQPRPTHRTLTFLLLDHIGGINTLLHTLANGGTVVTVVARDPDTVCAAIARHRVELLPTSPTFLNLLLVSEAYRRHDLSSLELITYGTEVMPEGTLARLRQALPQVRLQQTYGLSEVGILRSKSRGSDSLWVKVGGEGFETKVVGGTLWIRARSAMLGYLNAPSPFDEEGWLNTEDAVEVDGEWIRILGRRSDLVNVGGQKVYPAEVESVLLAMPNVREAAVFGEPHPLTGQIVVARLTLNRPEELGALRRRVRVFCRDRLAPFKIPARIELADRPQWNARFKKMRKASP